MDLGNSRNTNDVIKRENNEYQDPEGTGHMPKTFNISIGLPRYDCESEASDGEQDLHMDVDDDEEPQTSSSVGGGDTSIESPADNYNMKLLAEMSSVHPTRPALNNQEEFYPHQHMQQHIGERGGDKQKQQQQPETNNYNSSSNELGVNNTFPWTGGVGSGASSSVVEPLYLTSTSSGLYHHPHTNSYLPSSSPSSSSSVKHHHHNNNRPQEIMINKQQGDSGKFTPELKSPLDQVVTGGGGNDAPAGGQHGSGGNDKQNCNRFQFSNSVDDQNNLMDDPPLNDRDKEHMQVLSGLLEDKDKQQQQQQQVGDNLPDYNHATQHQVYARPMTLPISNETSVHVQQQQFLSRKRSNDNLYVKIEDTPSAGDGVTNNAVIVDNTFSPVTSAAPHQLPSYSTSSLVHFDHDANFMNFHSNNRHHQQQQQINFEQANLHNIANNPQQQQGNKQQQQEANGSNCGGVGRNRRNSAVSLPSPKQHQRNNSNKQYQQQIMDHNEYQQQQYQQQQQQPSTTTTLIQYGAATSNHVADANVNPLLAIANAAVNEKLIAEEGGGTAEQQQQLYQQQTNTQQAFAIPPQLLPQFNQQQQVYLQGFTQQQQQNEQETSAATGDATTEPPRGGILVVGDNAMQHYTTYTNNNIQHNSLSLLAVAAANQNQLETTNQQQQQNEAELVNLTVDELNPSEYTQPADLSTNSHNNDVTGWMTSQQQGSGGGATNSGQGGGGFGNQDNETSPIRTNHDPFISPANMTSSAGGTSSSVQAPSSGDVGDGGNYGSYGTRDGGNPVVNNIALNAVEDGGKVGSASVTFGNSFGPGYHEVDPLMAEAYDVTHPSNILPHCMMGGTPSGGAFFQGSSSRPSRQRHHSEGAHLIRSNANNQLKYSPPLPPPQAIMTSQHQQRHQQQQHNYQQVQQRNNNMNKSHMTSQPKQVTSSQLSFMTSAGSGFHTNNSTGGSSAPTSGGSANQQHQRIENYDVTGAATAGDFPPSNQQQLLNNVQQQTVIPMVAGKTFISPHVVTSQASSSSGAIVTSQQQAAPKPEQWVKPGLPGPRPIIDHATLAKRRRRRHSADTSVMRLNARHQHNSMYYQNHPNMSSHSRIFKKLALGSREHRIKTIPPPLHIPQSVNTLTGGGSSSNTLFQSNLHQRPSRRPSGESNTSLSLSGSTFNEKMPPYTPPPMLSPMRPGSGLYCKTPGTPSAKFMRQVSGSESLASSIPPILEVDENQHETNSIGGNSVGSRSRHSSIHVNDYDVTSNTADYDSEGEEISIRSSEPKINLGPRFQATIPPRVGRPGSRAVSPRHEGGSELLWKADTTSLASDEKFREIERYLDLSCSAVMPYGGTNKELALHILYRCGCNIEEATKMLIMNPTTTTSYHYTGSGRLWTDNEIQIFNENLEEKTKDFFVLSKQIVTRTTADCVERYYHAYKRKHQKEKNERKVRMKRTTAATARVGGGLEADIIQQNYDIQSRSLHIATDVNDIPMQTSYDPQHQGISYNYFTPPPYNAVVTSQNNKQQPPYQQQQLVTNQQIAQLKAARMASPSASPGGSPGSSVASSQPDEFQCPVCHKSFPKVKSRNAHMKTHGKQAQEKRRQREQRQREEEEKADEMRRQQLYVTQQQRQQQYNPQTIQQQQYTTQPHEHQQIPDVLNHYVNEGNHS